MTRTRVVVAACFTLALVACDGDGDGDSGDVGQDAVADTDADVGVGAPDGETGPGEQDPGEEPPAEICDDETDNDGDDRADCADADCADEQVCVEICDDEVDNDGDGESDCDDPDCLGLAPCPENASHACGDRVDNDLDGWVDCEDADCAPYCPRCEPPCYWDGRLDYCSCPPPVVEDFRGPFSFITRIRVPERDGEECCIDFDGDNVVDNGLALLAAALPVFVGDEIDLNALVAGLLEADELTLVLQWGKGENEAGFHAYSATNDVDPKDGEPDQDWATRSAGDGVFQILEESLDEYGALVQFNIADIDESGENPVVTAGPSLFRLQIPIDVAGISLDLDLTIEQATVTGEWMLTDKGVESVDETFTIDEEEVEFGGWKLGGVVPLDQIGELLETLAADCACANFDDSMPIIDYGDDGTTYVLECAQTPTGECTADDGVVCENIALVCSFLPSLPSLGLNDIDTDANGVGDALSVGIRISAVGATLAYPPVEGQEGSGEGSGE